MITVYNTNEVDHSMKENNIYMGAKSLFENPFGHKRGAKKSVTNKLYDTKKEMLEAYGQYFDKMYEVSGEFRYEVDRIYDLYKRNEDLYFQCEFKTAPSYGDVIAKKLQSRLLREIQEKQKENSRLK